MNRMYKIRSVGLLNRPAITAGFFRPAIQMTWFLLKFVPDKKICKMKRILLTLAGLFVAALTFAQSLDGTWTATMSMEEKKDTADVSMTMSVTGYDTMVISGSSCTMKEKAVLTIGAVKGGEKVTMGATITGKVTGTIAREGDILVFTPVKKPKPEVTVETDNLPGILKALVVSPLKNEMAKDLKEPDRSRIVSISAQEMVLEEILTEKQIRKGQKPERATYRKKL